MDLGEIKPLDTMTVEVDAGGKPYFLVVFNDLDNPAGGKLSVQAEGFKTDDNFNQLAEALLLLSQRV